MDPNNAIEVRNLHKYFKIYDDKGKMLRERIIHWNRNKYEKREVLKGISFDVKKGEAVGIIGSNGCGKSTTLKLLTRILRPNAGTIDIDGKVYSMIELGAGFHPDMSGRENIYINASIFGIKAKEVDRRIDEIIEFSELEEFIDNPVRTYSSGMYMRLAFSIAINVDADILLVDEILAVGDAGFQAKCFDKLREIKGRGTTIVIVSHDTGQIERICNKCIWINDGIIESEGSPSEVGMEYADFIGKRRNKKKKAAEAETKETDTEKQDIKKPTDGNDKSPDKNDEEKRKVEITDAYLIGQEERQTNFKVGDAVTLRVHYKKNEDVDNPLMGLKIYRNDMIVVYGINSQNDLFNLNLKDEGFIDLVFQKLNFVAGMYHIDVAIREGNMLLCDYKTNIIEFTTYYLHYEDGIAHIEHEWRQK